MTPGKAPQVATREVTRGELVRAAARGGDTLVWLWPRPAPLASEGPQVLADGGRLSALTLRTDQSLTLRRVAVAEAVLVEAAGGWEIHVPSTDAFCDVSRAPTRFVVGAGAELAVETEARGASRLWVDLAPVAGPGAAVVAPWAAVGVGPAVLWHVPEGQAAASRRVRPVPPPLRKRFGTPGFRCFSSATMDIVSALHRRAAMRVYVPRSTTTDRWQAGQPFILAGETGCGKTTLAKAVYSVVGAHRFAAVHPVAVEQEIDLVALTGCRDLAHDGRRVPDQEGHLDVATHPEGVVLIDEVHSLDERLKQYLTDILTEWTFRPRGDTTARKKIRGLILYASNRPDVLRDPARFPHDLFARMGGEAGIIEVPPLRRRRWEVPSLAAAVLDGLSPRLELAPDAVRKLLLHCWPQNHWELEDALREAHSLAASADLAEIPPHLLKLRPPPAPQPASPPAPTVAVTAPGPTAPAVPAAPGWRIPAVVGWRVLFQGLRHLGSFSALRDAWKQQLGLKNAATVNRRIGRLVRCDRCDPQTCPRCFTGSLTQREPAALLEELERLAGDPAGDAGWIADALGELVVDRLESYRTGATRAALEAARATPDRQRLLELIGALRSG